MPKLRKQKNNSQRDGKTYAIIYCRVSSERQANEGHGLDSQENRCRQYANQKGYEVVEVFRDSFTGGGDFMKRPAMSGLLSYVGKNAHKRYVVIFDDLKRFARDVAKHWELRHLFEKLGIELESPNFEFKNDSEEGWLNETVNAVFNEYDRRTNKRQVVQKMKSRLELGYWTFGSKKGYTIVKQSEHGKIAVPNDDGKILAQAIEGFANGIYVRKIDVCKFLVEKGFWTKQIPERYIDKLTYLLKDSFYAGFIEYPEWEVSRRVGKHMGIISLETYEMVQKRLGKLDFGKRIRKDISDDFKLRGLLVCDDCQSHLTGAWTKGRNKRHPYYLCQNRDCPSCGKSIKRSDVEDKFSELLIKTKLRKDVSILVDTVFDRTWEDEVKNFTHNQNVSVSTMKELEGKIASITNLILSSNSDILRKIYEGQIEGFGKEIEEINSNVNLDLKTDDIPYRTALNKVTGLLKSPYSIWVYLSTKEKQDLFYFIFEQKLPYSKKDGYRTDKIPTAIRLFEDFVNQNTHGVEMAGIEPACKMKSYRSLHV
jgi:site-specific DNA recombinase